MAWILATVLAGAAPCAAVEYEVFDGTGGHAAGAPIVMVLHGAGGSGPQVRRSTGFDRWARARGVVAVYPSGGGRLWNDGRFAGNPRRADLAQRDDVAALLAIAAELDARGLGDAGRLYVIGHSNGGGMAMRLACDRPDAVQGIAVVATKVLKDVPCRNPGVPVPAVFFYGTADGINPHGGRRDPANRRDRALGLSLSAEESLAVWARRNGCAAPGPARLIDPAADGVRVLRFDWRGCRAPLRYFETEGGGHAWPGARPPRIVAALGGGEPWVRDIDAGREALDFLLARP
ncbi:MAG: hypothetical protein N2422_12955 [Rhodobacteraceae bacterium]|nr:hypothetical protein [Paracoccaceae bacterium]